MLRTRRLAVLALSMAGVLLAGSGSYAATTAGWLCEIDLAGAGIAQPRLPASVFTYNTTKICTGAAPSKVQIVCNGTIPGWQFGQLRTVQGFPCQISLAQCGQSGFVQTRTSSLTVDRTGNARLSCEFNR